MVSLQVVTVLMAISAPGQSAPGETVLLDFTAPWCGPCQQMHPTVDRLAAAGFPVRKVNVDQDKQLAARFGVSNIPCFVLLVNGKEVKRAVGSRSYGQLAQMFKAAGVSSGGQRMRGQSPGIAPRSRNAAEPFPSSGGPSRTFADPSAGAAVEPNTHRTQPDDRATAKMIAASVRIQVKDATGFSNGSGTIIDVHGEEALILTCGHIFRDSNGKGEVTVDLFGANPVQGIKADLITFDLKRDLGLLSFRPTVPVTAARVAGLGYKISKGDKVTSVGCDRGTTPTALKSQVSSTRKFLGPPHVMVAGRPVIGRSGGGLFDKDGLVIGVCNASDDEDNEGMYASIEAILDELDDAKLAFVYRGDTTNQPLAGAKRDTSPDDREPPVMMRDIPAERDIAATAFNPGRKEIDMRETLTGLPRDSGEAEVICIVRSLDDPNSKSDVIVLDRVSREFLKQLRREQTTQSGRHLTADRRLNSSLPKASVRRDSTAKSLEKPNNRSSAWHPIWRKPTR